MRYVEQPRIERCERDLYTSLTSNTTQQLNTTVARADMYRISHHEMAVY